MIKKIKEFATRAVLALGLLTILLVLGDPACAQTQAQLPPGMQQFSDGNGAPYSGGNVYFYVPGTTTPKSTYLDPNGITPNTNPVILDANGRAIIWGSGLYREVLQDALGNTIWDQLIYGVGGSNGSAGGALCAQYYTTGSANAQQMSTTPTSTVLTAGTLYCAVAGYTNTGASNLNVNNLGFYTVKKPTASGLQLLTGGEIQVGQAYLWQWDGTEFVLTNPTIASPNTYNVANYCSDYNGVVDNTSCIQSAINAACSGAGGTVSFPAGKFTVAASTGVTITCPGIYLVGQGYSDPETNGSNPATVVFATGTGGNSIFKWQGAAGQRLKGGGIRNMTVQGTDIGASNPQTGWAVDFEFCDFCMVQDTMVYLFQNNVIFNTSSYGRVAHTFMHQVNLGGTAVQFQGNDSSGTCVSNVGNCPTRSDQLWLTDTLADSQLPQSSLPAGTCIRHVDFAATLNGTNMVCAQFLNGYYSNCPTSVAVSECPSFATFVNLQAETNGQNSGGQGFGMFMQDTQVVYVSMSSFFGYTSSSGITMQPGRFGNNGQLIVNGGKIESFQNDCILVSANGVVLTNLEIDGCGTAGVSGATYGIELRSGSGCSVGGCNDYTISNNTFCTTPNGVPNGFNAIGLGSGINFFTVEGNKFKGCTTGVTNGTSGATGYVSTTSNLGP